MIQVQPSTVATVCPVVSGMQGGTWDRHPNFKWLKRFKNDSQRRDFVTCGAAAGVAAAFRAPVGGVLFGLEELSTHWSEHLLLTCFFTTAVVNVTVRLLMSYCSGGGCGFFGEGQGEEGNTIIFHMKGYQVRVQSARLSCRTTAYARKRWFLHDICAAGVEQTEVCKCVGDS